MNEKLVSIALATYNREGFYVNSWNQYFERPIRI